MRPMMLDGRVFGSLRVLKIIGSNNYKKSTWLCLCSCGKEHAVMLKNKHKQAEFISLCSQVADYARRPNV